MSRSLNVRQSSSWAKRGKWSGTPAPVAPGVGSRPKIGIYRSYQTSAAALAAAEAVLGRQYDYVLEFQGTESVPNLGWPGYMRSHYTRSYMGTRQLMLGASLSPSKVTSGNYYDRVQTWQQLASGEFDATWTAMATNLVADGLGSSVLRGAHEFNEPMFAHRVLPGEEAAFVAAWRRWHGVVMAVPGANFHFNWNPTTGDYNGNGLDTVACYPGDAYVDTIDLDLYDRWYPRGTNSGARTLAEQQDKWQQMLTMNTTTWRGLNYWRSFAVSHGKGMGFSEWGTGSYFNDADGNHGGGDNEVFMNGMADFILDPAYPPGVPGGVVDHAFWEDGIEGIMPVTTANPDQGRAIPVPKMRAIFLARFGGAASTPSSSAPVDPSGRGLTAKFYTDFSGGFLPDVFEPLGGGKPPAYGGNAYLQSDGSSNPYNKEMQWMRPDCVRIQPSGYSAAEGNVLALTTKAEPYTTTLAANRTDTTFDYLVTHPNTGAGRDANGNPKYPYRAGMVATQSKRITAGQTLTVSGSKNWTATARMRWTQADGYWPAWWMLADDQTPVFSWVTELDGMEDFSPRVFGANKVVANMFKNGTQLPYNEHKVRSLDLTQFHTWRMQFEQTGSAVTAGQKRFRVFVDDVVFFDSDFYRNLGQLDNTWFYTGQMHFIFQGAQIGGTGSNGNLTEGQAGWRDLSAAAVAALPLRMEISHFGVWEDAATPVGQVAVAGHPTSAPLSTPRTTSASPVRRAQDVVDIYGVAGHLTYPAYSNYAKVTEAMDYLGCKNFRDGWGTGRQAVADYVIGSFRPRGIKLCLVHDSRDWPAGTTAVQMVAQHKAYGYISDVRFAEGSNELDLSNNLASARTQALAHTAAYKADPDCAHIIRAGPSLADTNTDSKYQSVGILPDATACTFHDYPGVDRMMSGPVDGTDSSYAITNTLGRNARYVVPTPSGTPVDVISTECGFSSGTTGDGGKNMPDAARSAQELRIWLEHARGIGSGDRAVNVLLSCNYELVDQGTGTDTEVRFGLFTNDWQPKPAATAIRNLTLLLSDPSPTALSFTPNTLGQTLGGTDADTRSLLMQKADGSWLLALWQEWATWNGTTTLNPTPKALTLTLPTPRAVITYEPASSATGTSRGTASSFSLSCGASPLIVRLV